jgi:hypothetical protein
MVMDMVQMMEEQVVERRNTGILFHIETRRDAPPKVRAEFGKLQSLVV